MRRIYIGVRFAKRWCFFFRVIYTFDNKTFKKFKYLYFQRKPCNVIQCKRVSEKTLRIVVRFFFFKLM